jgi:LruC domain-containing protein
MLIPSFCCLRNIKMRHIKASNLLWLILLAPLVFSACKRDFTAPGDTQPADNSVNIKDIDKLIAPANFNFTTTKDLTVRVKVTAVSYPEERFRINIYLFEPSTGGVAVQAMTDENNELTAVLRVPIFQEYIWIEKVDVFGDKVVSKVAANKFVSTLFANGAEPAPYIFNKASSGLTCNTGCGTNYNNYSGNVTVSSGVVCITGTFSGKLTVTGSGIVKYCALGTMDTLTLDGNARVYVLERSRLIVNKILSNTTTTQFYNWTDSLVVNNCLSIKNYSENHGRMYVNCSVTVESTGDFGNYGKLAIANNLTVDNTLTNYDHITVTNNVVVNAGKNIYNYCDLTAKNGMTINGTLTSNSLTKAVGTITTGAGSKIALQNGALLSCANLILNDQIISTGNKSSYVKVTAVSTINSGGKLQGKTNYCDANGVETNNGTVVSPSQFTCSGYIATNTCNTEGFGALIIPDADGDGIADVLDEYPNDATRAFNRYYPCATTCSNIVFEDLWPSKGDYDYNDLVVAFNVQKVINATNTVVDYKTKIKPRCVGAGFDNGFGFSLDNIFPNEVLSVSGQSLIRGKISLNANKTEAGQSRAVIICFDSPEPYLHRQGGSMFNTIKNNPFCQSDTNFTSVSFATALADNRVVFEEFNPFIIVNLPNGRGIEVHMANHKPTSLANPALFGSSADRSVPANGIYYKSANGLPWAMQIPENFNYPSEKSSILDAYNYFDDWAISGGTAYPNWYRNFGSYRNIEYIY